MFLPRIARHISTSHVSPKVLLPPNGLNPTLQSMDYAVRGALVQRADHLSRQLRDPSQTSSLPFSRIVYCNIGNPQSVGQPPLTFVRQIISAFAYPNLLSSSHLPPDVVSRVRTFLDASHGAGAYTESPGLPLLRERVASAITDRDRVASHPENIFLTSGASEAVKTLLSIIVRGPQDGVMIPIPQYPLYSATITALGGVQVQYFLDEDDNWSLSVDQLNQSIEAARANGVSVRALVVINPGNPTGQVLSRKNIEDVIRFCHQHNLVLLADEVYQSNVYVDHKPFISFKQAVSQLGLDVELASFHSVSKGIMGECGLRAGYVELHNIDRRASDLVYKVLSVGLCSNAIGQVAIDTMMNPPRPDEPSYDLYRSEFDGIFGSLKRKSILLCNAFNTFEGVTCNPSEGAMYLFPNIALPQKAIREALSRGMPSADVLYCLELLEETGICVVPGSGFGQREGTLHFRTTFLPPEDQIEQVAEQMRAFHHKFLNKFS
uniref:Alanine transaminase n=1 Tax=Heterosiphonia pulchra TaxID=189631 RepID=A0A097IU10_9FLOR|nr:alanine transaminase [Heterosiphonia pulchra]